jgi:hypothetical protein
MQCSPVVVGAKAYVNKFHPVIETEVAWEMMKILQFCQNIFKKYSKQTQLVPSVFCSMNSSVSLISVAVCTCTL